MPSSGGLRRALAGWACGLLGALVAPSLLADGIVEPCRIAFDIGSSGIRAGASNSSATAQADIDYLGPLLSGRGLEAAVGPTVAALRELPERAHLGTRCARVGGGFSAWRLALQQDGSLVPTLTRIRAASGVPVLVIPQSVEGAYGYLGARRLLGDKLLTSHVLDIGGGSLQIAGERTTFGDALGQKIWHRHLCQAIRQTAATPCALQPLSPDELAAARALLGEKLKGVETSLPKPVTLTAISRPVTRGVAPGVARLLDDRDAPHILTRTAIGAAIDRLAGLTPAETAAAVGGQEKHVAYLLSDLLLVEGVLRAADASTLRVAEIDVNNLSGLLADPRAYAWSANYACYLERLSRLGIEAYASDPATCPGEAKRRP